MRPSSSLRDNVAARGSHFDQFSDGFCSGGHSRKKRVAVSRIAAATIKSQLRDRYIDPAAMGIAVTRIESARRLVNNLAKDKSDIPINCAVSTRILAMEGKQSNI